MTDTRNVTVELADLRAKVAFLADTLTTRTEQRDRARDWAVRMEQELAEERTTHETDLRRYLDGNIRAGEAITALSAQAAEGAVRARRFVEACQAGNWADVEIAMNALVAWCGQVEAGEVPV